jgi:primase-polymerase (primpol)-like protein
MILPAQDCNPTVVGEALGLPPRPPSPPLHPDQIPAELKRHRRWVVWRYDWRDATGKWAKPPYSPRTGCAADATDPGTWGLCDDALAAYQRGGWDGIGFVVYRDAEGDTPGPDLVAFDLDKCIDPETQEIEPWAADVVKELATYAERSPSGLGIRLLARGQKPGLRCRKGGFEMYEHARYVTLTGWRLDDSPVTIESRQAAIDAVYARLLGGPGHEARPRATTKLSDAPTAEGSLTADDLALLEKARAAANGPKFARLWDGDWKEAYDSQSEADLALCSILAFWAGPDPERIDRLFRQSGLMREKWDRSAGDQTYGERTVARALEDNNVAPAGGRVERCDREHLTDVGNARRLVRAHGDVLRYCHPWCKWLVWDGRRWRLDDTGEVVKRAKATLRELLQGAATAAAAVATEMESESDGTNT